MYGPGERRRLTFIKIAQRLAATEHRRGRPQSRIMLSDGTQPEALASPDHGLAAGRLTGTPASAGTVTGTARVVLDPVGAAGATGLVELH